MEAVNIDVDDNQAAAEPGMAPDVVKPNSMNGSASSTDAPVLPDGAVDTGAFVNTPPTTFNDDNLAARALPKHVQEMADGGIPTGQWVAVAVVLGTMVYQLRKVLSVSSPPPPTKRSPSSPKKKKKVVTAASFSPVKTTAASTSPKKKAAAVSSPKSKDKNIVTVKATTVDAAVNDDEETKVFVTAKKRSNRKKKRRNKGITKKRIAAHSASSGRKMMKSKKDNDFYDIDAIVAEIENIGKKKLQVKKFNKAKKFERARLRKRSYYKRGKFTPSIMSKKKRSTTTGTMSAKARAAESARKKASRAADDDHNVSDAGVSTDATPKKNEVSLSGAAGFSVARFNTSTEREANTNVAAGAWTTVSKFTPFKVGGSSNYFDQVKSGQTTTAAADDDVNEVVSGDSKVTAETSSSAAKEKVSIEVKEIDTKINPFATAEKANTLSWKDVNVTISDKPVLSCVSGKTMEHKATAILGKSYEAKTSMLNVLSGRAKTHGQVSVDGVVQLNDKDAVADGKEIAYITQNYFLQLTWTPRKAMFFAAKLQFPRYVTTKQLDVLVDKVIAELDLIDYANTVVKDLSICQRMLTILGIELIKKPKMILLNDPLKGVESEQDATKFCNVLGNIAKRTESVVVFTADNDATSRDTLVANDQILVMEIDAEINPFASLGKANTLSWKDVNVTKSGKLVLSGVSGKTMEHKATAILGKSYEAKTSLLNVLSRRSKTHGQVSFNGVVKLNDKESIVDGKEISYIAQNYSLELTWTTRKAIFFAAKSQYPRYVTTKQLDVIVDKVITELDLIDYANTLIKDLSICQRMLTILGIELIKKPKMILLNSPLRGVVNFDESDATKFCNVLGNIAKISNSVIMFTADNETTSRDTLLAIDQLLVIDENGKMKNY